ncbi:outer membrane protein [Ancylobacter terrae]|uniref:outer membrane protein n=1 Tax=Ancylobacter sp. sgz301288 TaxID=3342077 RepID=UPI00385C7392
MRGLMMSAIAGLAALAAQTGAGLAADMPEPVYKAPEIPVAVGGWYLRGDIGVSWQDVDNLVSVENQSNDFIWLGKNFDAAAILGVGVGYKFNDWFRADVTGEYRAKSSFSGVDTYDYWNGDEYIARTNHYTADKQEWVFLANAYLDLGTWHSITPFVGAGIGAASVKVSNYSDWDPTPGYESLAYAGSDTKWNFAWALYAGLAYQITPTFSVEVAYRYIDLGDGRTADVVASDGTNNYYNPVTFEDITSQDVKIGFRWLFGGGSDADDYPPVRKY